MLDIPSFEAVQFLPPEVPKEFDGIDIPDDVSNSFAPAMTTDPFIPALDEISDMLSVLRSNMVIVSSGIAEQLDHSSPFMPVTLINAKRQMFAVKLNALSLKETNESPQ